MNSIGRIFRVSVYGESHGPAVGVMIDGCPPGISIHEDDFTTDLKRRKPGSKGTTTRIEQDAPTILSGVYKGLTTGAPILIQFENQNIRSKDYSEFRETPRPGHADFTAHRKYNGFNDHRGGGHFSGRLTLGLVAAGVLAKKIIHPINIQATVIEIGGSSDLEGSLQKAIDNQDSVGTLVACKIDNIPVGLGEPFFDSFESNLSHIVFSIPAVKGIEFGAGFNSASMYGSEMNDMIIDKSGTTTTNYSGGINGGISNGNPIEFKIAVKPASSISKKTGNL